MTKHLAAFIIAVIAFPARGAERASLEPEIVRYQSGKLTLRGELFKPPGAGPFPAVLYNHGNGPPDYVLPD